MPMINIKYDDRQVADDKIIILATAIQKIVSAATKIKEVFVYADSPRIKIEIAPIEIFIEMSASKIINRDELFQDIKSRLISWKEANKFQIPVTITLTPVDWRFEVGI